MPRRSPEELDGPAVNRQEQVLQQNNITHQAPMSTQTAYTTHTEVQMPAGQPVTASDMIKTVEGNPYKKWIYLAAAVDSWRIWPRLFLTVYVILVYKVVTWFMSLGAPSMEQSGLVSIVVGAGAAWFGLYLGSSPRK